MHTLVIFDVPADAPRELLQTQLSRVGFRRIFPNAYEHEGAVPGLRELERNVVRALHGQVYRLRIYVWGGHTKMLERWGR